MRTPRGQHRDPRTPAARGSRLRTLALLLPAAAAWVVLVRLAIGFGDGARAGAPENWLFLALAALAAVGVLMLVMTLGARLLLGVGSSGGPANDASTTDRERPRVPGSHRPRAAR